jgi:uncharacterized RDD family membrane protein YckC
MSICLNDGMADGLTTQQSAALEHHDAVESVMTGEAVALDLRPTSFVLAAAGAAIDWLVYQIGGTLFLYFVIVIPLAASPLGQDSAAMTAVGVAGEVLVLVIIPIIVELLSRGKSLGRLAVGARIVRDDGGAIGFRHAFIRSLLSLLEIFATLGGLAALVGLLNGRSKRLGDFLAGTYSQYERVPRERATAFGMPSELVDWARTADVARIPNRLALRLSRFVQQAGAMTPVARDQVGRQLAAEASVWVSPVPQASAELFIVGVVVLRRDRESTALMLERERMAHLDTALTALPHAFPER